MIDLAISRKLSVMSFLHESGPLTLGELASHYGLAREQMHNELRELFCIEIVDGDGTLSLSALDVNFDLDSSDPDTLVELSPLAQLPRQSLGLDELIAVLSLIDLALNVGSDHSVNELLHLRESLVVAAVQAGFGSAIWPLATPPHTRELMQLLTEAAATAKEVEFSYWKRDLHSDRASQVCVRGCVLELVAAENPVVHLRRSDGALRVYRADRITDFAVVGKGLSKRDHAHWRAQMRRSEPNWGERKARITCSAKARWVAETVPGVEVVEGFEASSSNIILDVPFRSEAWLLSLLVQMDDAVHRVEPRELAQALGEAAEQIANLIGTDETTAVKNG